MLDGVDNNAYGTSNQGFSNQVIQPNPDALQEFKMETNNYSAEYGRASGAVINATIKSGTNQFHGELWEFLRNTDLNAAGFFKPVGGVKPAFNQNQFGGAGGRTHHERQALLLRRLRRFPPRLSSGAVCDAADRGQDNQGISAYAPIANPYTGEVYANGIIPSSQFTPLATRSSPRCLLRIAPSPRTTIDRLPATRIYERQRRFPHGLLF